MPINPIAPDELNAGPKMNSRAALKYPNNYFDLAQTYFPSSIKELFEYCIYFYNTHCIVPAVVNKLASYPITELVFAAAEEKVTQQKWRELFIDQMNLPFEMYQIGIDMGVYGNSFIGIYFPFKRYLSCPLCNSLHPMSRHKNLKIKGSKLDIMGECLSCSKPVKFEMKDKYIRTTKGLKLIRYDPLAIDILADPVSGDKEYVWDPPTSYKDAIKDGSNMRLWEKAPKVIIDAIREDKKIIMNRDTFFHMKRPSLSGQCASWGFPLIMHALKSLYYLQILKRAQEAIAQQHIIPLWALYPSNGGGNSSLPPAANIGLNRWKNQVEDELKKWRADPNHIPVFNIPIGFQHIGGEGRALLLAPEIQQEIQQVVASMSVPQEFVFGGLTWTGSSITLRMLENSFQGTRDSMQRLIKFLVKNISGYLRYKAIDIYMSELKMADDIQRQQIAMNLEAAGKISETRLLAEFGYDYTEEKRLKREEFAGKLSGFIRDSVLQARAQGEASVVSVDYQIQAQKKQIAAEGDMMVTQAKSQAKAQEELSAMGLMPAMGAPAEEQGQPAEYTEEQVQQESQPYPSPDMAYADPGASPMGPYGEGAIDEATGLPIDPTYGLPVDQASGLLIDLATGTAIEPQSGMRIDLATGEQISQEEFSARNPAGTSLMPSSAGSETSLQKTSSVDLNKGTEAKKEEQEQRAKAGVQSSNMPPSIKKLVTSFANELLSTDPATQRDILSRMEVEQPTVALLVKRRMSELSQITPAIRQPAPPSVASPAGLKPTTVSKDI